MTTLLLTLLSAYPVLTWPPGGLFAEGLREAATVEAAADTLKAFADLHLRGIPPALLRNAQGVAIVPGMVKGGFVIGVRHGHGVLLVRGPHGGWGNPLFVTLTGGSVGLQAGVQSTDLLLVFKTRGSLDRLLAGKGNLTLGADAAVAAGPLGRQAEAATDAQLRAEIYSYSRSRGLFAGFSVEGSGLQLDPQANATFYRIMGGRAVDVLTLPAVPEPAARLREQLTRMSAPPLPNAGHVPALLPPVALPPQPTLPPIPPPPAPPRPDK